MESDPEHNPAILNPDDPSRLSQEAENMVVEVIYKPPGNHNQDPGDEPITYALLQMGEQLIGALWIATTGGSRLLCRCFSRGPRFRLPGHLAHPSH